MPPFRSKSESNLSLGELKGKLVYNLFYQTNGYEVGYEINFWIKIGFFINWNGQHYHGKGAVVRALFATWRNSDCLWDQFLLSELNKLKRLWTILLKNHTHKTYLIDVTYKLKMRRVLSTFSVVEENLFLFVCQST